MLLAGLVAFSKTAPPPRPPDSAWYLQFNGIDDYVEVPDSPSLDVSEELTVEVWVKPEGLPSKNSYLICGKPGRWWVEGYEIGVVCWISVSGFTERSAFVQIPVKTFSHLAWTYRSGELVGYVNGRPVSSQTGIVGEIDHSVGINLRVSNDFPATEGFWGAFHGLIDDVRIYNRALEPEEVQKNFEGDVATDGLVLWLGFEEGKGDTVYDSSPYHNDGIVRGGSWVKVPSSLWLYREVMDRYIRALTQDKLAVMLSAFGLSFLLIGLPWKASEILSSRSERFKRFTTKPLPSNIGAYIRQDPSRLPIFIFIFGLMIASIVFSYNRELADGILAYCFWFVAPSIFLQVVWLLGRT